MDLTESNYKISRSIYGHNADVRAVAPSPLCLYGILSGSRDFTARIWEPDSSGYHEVTCLEGHTNFVSCVTAFEPSEENPEGLVVTGCSDKKIRVFTPKSEKPELELSEHTDTVCTLAAGKFNMVVSGSWDKTAKVWIFNRSDSSGKIEGRNVMTLSGHEASVWSVLILQQGVMVTGSADRTIKLWKAGKCLKTLTGHEDCVRGLAMISACQFLSCGNDATVRRWTTNGECIQVYYGHTSFIYAVYLMPGETEFVTSGEDRTLRVWSLNDNEAKQAIALPAQSAWSVTVLQNGDIVTGLSDGTIRIFSRCIERIAPEQEAAAYEEEVASRAITKSGNDMGDVDVENTPGMEALLTQGKKEGQVLMVRNDDKVEAHQWSMSDSRWVKIGDVVGGRKQKKMYNGKEYDFVFDVDIKEGSPALKLPYNLSEDPWMAAQTFIDDNDLSQYFLEQICDFIIDNTKEARKGNRQEITTASGYSDPFTGGSRFVPESSKETENTNGFQDPFTGGGRYMPGNTDSEVSLGGGAAADPMLNPNRYIPGDVDAMDTTSPASSASYRTVMNDYFPKSGYIKFESANIDAIIAKLTTFSSDIAQTLSEGELNDLRSLTISSENSDQDGLNLLWKLLQWPEDKVFPALDILRLMCLRQPHSCKLLCSGESEDDKKPAQLLHMLCMHISATGNSKHVTANKLLSLRTLCNMFTNPDGSAFLTAGFQEIFDALSKGFTEGIASNNDSTSSAPFHGNKNLQLASSSVLLNFSVLAHSADSQSDLSQTVHDLTHLLRQSCVEITIVHLVSGTGEMDPEAVFRYLVCLGTLISENKGNKLVNEANSLGAVKVTETAASFYSAIPKIVKCANLLSATFSSNS